MICVTRLPFAWMTQDVMQRRLRGCWAIQTFRCLWGTFVTKDKEFDVKWSQVTLSDEVFQGNPEDFVFDDEALPLKYDGYNPIVQNLAEWRRNVELDFRIRLYEAELNKLRRIKSQTDKADSLENGFNGILGLFRTAMNDHIG